MEYNRKIQTNNIRDNSKKIKELEKKLLQEINYPQKTLENISNLIYHNQVRRLYNLSKFISDNSNLNIDVAKIITSFVADYEVLFTKIISNHNIKHIEYSTKYINSLNTKDKYQLAEKIEFFQKSNFYLKGVYNNFEVNIAKDSAKCSYRFLIKKYFISSPFKIINYTILDNWQFQTCKKGHSLLGRNILYDDMSYVYRIHKKISYNINDNLIVRWMYFPIMSEDYTDLDIQNYRLTGESHIRLEILLRAWEEYLGFKIDSFICRVLKYSLLIAAQKLLWKIFEKPYIYLPSKLNDFLKPIFSSRYCYHLHTLGCFSVILFLKNKHYPFYDRFYEKIILNLFPYSKKVVRSYFSKM